MDRPFHGMDRRFHGHEWTTTRPVSSRKWGCFGPKFHVFSHKLPCGGPSPGNGADKRGSAADRPWHARAPHGRTGGGKSQQCLTPAGPKRRRAGSVEGFNVFPRRTGLSLFFRTLPRLRPARGAAPPAKGAAKTPDRGRRAAARALKKGWPEAFCPAKLLPALKKNISLRSCAEERTHF